MSTIQKGQDGVYRWPYELDLYRNPTILLVILKIFSGIYAGLYFFLVLFSAGDAGFWWKGFLRLTAETAVFLAFFLALATLAYLLYAVFMGGKYCVLFEMDEKGLRHTQAPKQVTKAQLLAQLTLFAGAAAHSPGAVGTGLLAGSRSSLYTAWSAVKSIKPYPRRGVVKVNALFEKNQVYAEPEDFAFVRSYIETHVAGARKK